MRQYNTCVNLKRLEHTFLQRWYQVLSQILLNNCVLCKYHNLQFESNIQLYQFRTWNLRKGWTSEDHVDRVRQGSVLNDGCLVSWGCLPFPRARYRWCWPLRPSQGKSSGEAEVTFHNRGDANKAIKECLHYKLAHRGHDGVGCVLHLEHFSFYHFLSSRMKLR